MIKGRCGQWRVCILEVVWFWLTYLASGTSFHSFGLDSTMCDLQSAGLAHVDQHALIQAFRGRRRENGLCHIAWHPSIHPSVITCMAPLWTRGRTYSACSTHLQAQKHKEDNTQCIHMAHADRAGLRFLKVSPSTIGLRWNMLWSRPLNGPMCRRLLVPSITKAVRWEGESRYG